jgi:hypothetical protein
MKNGILRMFVGVISLTTVATAVAVATFAIINAKDLGATGTIGFNLPKNTDISIIGIAKLGESYENFGNSTFFGEEISSFYYDGDIQTSLSWEIGDLTWSEGRTEFVITLSIENKANNEITIEIAFATSDEDLAIQTNSHVSREVIYAPEIQKSETGTIVIIYTVDALTSDISAFEYGFNMVVGC